MKCAAAEETAMKNDNKDGALYNSAHLSILITYTLFVIILSAESLLMHWEIWAVILLIVGLAASWIMHLSNTGTAGNRIQVYSLLMMCTYFFYGTHETSTFDLAIVMSAVIVLFTLSGIKALITLCQVTYFITMAYELINMVVNGREFDALVISRILLHLAMIIVLGKLAKIIIDRWSRILANSKDEVEKLTDATERLNDFLANVSHELRTPINAVIGLSGVCLEKEQDPEVRESLNEIRSAGRRISDQISDILDYSEIDRNDLAINYEDYMLSSVLHDLVTELRPVKPRDIELVIDVDPAIPAVMNTDVAKLKKILKALISNGLKYTESGGVYVRITSELQNYGVNLRLEISDTGIGMTEEELERVTEQFYQSDSGRTRAAGGLGLGICIVNGFVSALGGFMTISSRKGEGTRVHVSIPQKVIDPGSCMSVADRDRLCIGAFLHFDKYSNPNVREYYNSMVRNIVVGLGVQMHRVDNVGNLKRLVDSTSLTHLFIADIEYEANKQYIEELSRKMVVAVVAASEFSLPENSWAKLMEKPFYCFPVTTILNMSLRDLTAHKEGRMMLKGIRALVVDDEPMNLTVATSILKRYGMIISTAASGAESIELCKSNEYDIVFMDHMMQGMDGVEAMKHIRAANQGSGRDFPIVALTANAMSTAKQMFLAEGFDGFVSKPIELEELERVMSRVLPRDRITYEHEDAAAADPGAAIHTKAVSDPEAAAASSPEEMIPEEDTAQDLLREFTKLGIDTAAGLHYCNQDEEFYYSLLLQYAGDMEKKLSLLEQYRTEKNYPDYAIHIHSIKSTSKMIGATELSEEARELELAAKEGNEAVIEAKHDTVIRGLESLTKALLSLLGESSAADEETAEPADDDILEFPAADDDIMEFPML